MKSTMISFAAVLLLGFVPSLNAAESNKYPTPRFPSYVKPPKSIDDIMPYARAAVRQTGGARRWAWSRKGR